MHQFCRVGQHAFIGGYSVVTKDALPFAKTVGNRARIYGVNTIGLDAPRLLARTLIDKLRRAYRHLLQSQHEPRDRSRSSSDPALRAPEVQLPGRIHPHRRKRGVGLRGRAVASRKSSRTDQSWTRDGRS